MPRQFLFLGQVLMACLVLGVAASVPSLGAGDRLPVWQVLGPSSRLVLLGSMHVAHPDIYPLRGEIEQAFDESQTLVVEVDVRPENNAAVRRAVQEHGQLAEGENLARLLGDDTLARLRAYVLERGMNMDVFSRMQPGLIAMTLTRVRLTELGMRPELGIDRHFLARASGQKSIVELESIEQQIDLLVSFPRPDLLLRQTLTELEDIEATFEPLFNAWKLGDEAELSRLIFASELRDNLQYQPVFDRFYTQRNVVMAARITALLNTAGSYFVVVGAGHLVGEQNIISILQGAGYRVTRI